MSEIYNRIRIRRQELGLTTDELAKKMGYKDRSSISKIENGKADIPQSKVKEFAEALDTSVSWLLGIDQTEEKAQPKSYKSVYIPDTSGNDDSVSHPYDHISSLYNDNDDARTQISYNGNGSYMCPAYAFDEDDEDDDDYADTVAKKRATIEREISSNCSSRSQTTNEPKHPIYQKTDISRQKPNICCPQNASDDLKKLEDFKEPMLECRMPLDYHISSEKSLGDNLLSCSDFPTNIQCDFAISCEDDGMSGIGIYKNDIAYIKHDFDFNDGNIVAVSVDNKVLLRRIYLGSHYVEFRPENPEIKSIIEDTRKGLSSIVGVLVGFTHCINQVTDSTNISSKFFSFFNK